MPLPAVIKLADIHTPIGTASLLLLNKTNLLSFAEVIDRDNKIDLDTHYGTLIWPNHLPLSRISEFPPGPALPGRFLIGVEDSFTSQAAPKDETTHNRPRHVRAFLSNVLAGLAASLLIGKL